MTCVHVSNYPENETKLGDFNIVHNVTGYNLIYKQTVILLVFWKCYDMILELNIFQKKSLKKKSNMFNYKIQCQHYSRNSNLNGELYWIAKIKC